MKIGIIGWGIEGKSAYNYFGPDHEYLIVNEAPLDDFPPQSDKVKVQYLQNDRPTGITGQVHDLSYLNGIEACDKIIYSVTSAKNLQAVFPADDKFWTKALTVQHIFFKEVKTRNIIGITGTKGKGTTSTLVAKMIEAAGQKVYLAGNIGLSVLDILPKVEQTDWVVLELSNFQLYSLNQSPHIAVCLMIVAEHLDWHPTVEDYVNAKANIFKYQTKEDIAIYHPRNDYSEHIAGLSKGAKLPYLEKPGAYLRVDGKIVVGGEETEVVKKSEIKLLGAHNIENVCAAVTATWQVHQNVEAMKQVISSFSGLEHRLEFVRDLDDVVYYDDSFGTTPDTAIVAMKAFVQPKVMIMGGSDKGASFETMVKEVLKQRIRHVILIGNTAPKIADLFKASNFTNFSMGPGSMSEIVSLAKSLAQPGDVVLLSTGCASFGLFKDYKDRGNQFKSAVQALA